MRAFLIDGYNQRIEEITLSAETATFYQQVRQHINSEEVDTIHPHKALTILFDPLAFAREGIPGFHLGIMVEFPLFGNVVCVGRNPVTYQIEGLSEEFTPDQFDVNWYNGEEGEERRKKAMQIGIDNYRS